MATRQALTSRLVYAAYTALALAFIFASTAQIVSAVLATARDGAGAGELRGHDVLGTTSACADGLAKLLDGLDRALGVAAQSRDDGTILHTFENARTETWAPRTVSDVERACASEPRGTDAFAALLRLERADEVFLQRRGVELGALRRDVAAYLH